MIQTSEVLYPTHYNGTVQLYVTVATLWGALRGYTVNLTVTVPPVVNVTSQLDILLSQNNTLSTAALLSVDKGSVKDRKRVIDYLTK